MVKQVKVIAEIGINHNGSIEECKKLILLAKVSGCNYVKIQKREPDICVPEEQKSKIKETPWGTMTYLEYKKRIEFSEEQIIELIEFSKQNDIIFFASVWDIPSAELMAKYTNIVKIGSACLTNDELIQYCRKNFETYILSTGMSSEDEIYHAIALSNPDIIMHTNSTYPCPVKELNLNYILWLKKKYPTKEIGYSGHEYGLVTTFTAVALGALWVERHITLDRNNWGSDQLSSIEPSGLLKLIKGIRDIEEATKFDPQERIEFSGELSKKKSLRG